MRHIVPILAIVALLAGTAGVQAQEDTGATFPYSPVVGDCQIEPRSASEILTLTAAGAVTEDAGARTSASSVAPATPAGEASADQAIATIREFAACIAAGDMLRTIALFTDGYVERLQDRTGLALEDDLLLNAVWATQGQFFLGDETWASTLAGFLESIGPASPEPAAGVSGSIQAVPAVWELGADRIAAAVTIEGLSCFMQCHVVFILVPDESTGRYLIDEAIEIFDLSEIPSG